MKLWIFCTLLILLNWINVGSGFNVLVLFPFIAKSHWLRFEYVIEELINRGHSVTAITSFKPQQRLRNYTEILIDPPYDVHTAGK